MCVIIFVPKTSTIEESEIRDAWNTNPHGAGYSIQKNGKVFYKRGFMDLEPFVKEIKPLNIFILNIQTLSSSQLTNKYILDYFSNRSIFSTFHGTRYRC